MLRKNAIFKVLAAVILLGVLIFFSASGPISSLREAPFRILKPFMNAAMNLGRTLEIETADMSNEQIKTLNFALEELRAENQTLKQALGFKEESGLPLKGGRVLLYSREFGKEFLVIDRGEKEGIKEGDLAVDAERLLVGVVRGIGKDFAKVGIASNDGEVFEGELVPAKARVLAKGRGSRAFSLELIPQDTPIRQGDFVALVSQKRNINFLLGQVASEKTNGTAPFKKAGAVLLARPEFLKEVFVVPASP